TSSTSRIGGRCGSRSIAAPLAVIKQLGDYTEAVPYSLIAENFRRTCRDKRDAIAVRALPDGAASTFGDLFAEFTAVRARLAACGARAGSTVVAQVGNRPAFFPLFAACMDLGAAFVGLGDATEPEVAEVVRRAGAAVIVTERGFTPSDPIDAPCYGESVVL